MIKIHWWTVVLVLLILANLLLFRQLLRVDPVEQQKQEFVPVYYSDWVQT